MDNLSKWLEEAIENYGGKIQSKNRTGDKVTISFSVEEDYGVLTLEFVE